MDFGAMSPGVSSNDVCLNRVVGHFMGKFILVIQLFLEPLHAFPEFGDLRRNFTVVPWIGVFGRSELL